ncbi:MAG: Addiction module toxin, RelE/StbE family [Leptospirillum sp. Group IV 'UBA BS']|nr:MAG: Addiction module toxin, RelE/StbE family [Leptospirillum sp. Group IV 'UBA BS']
MSFGHRKRSKTVPDVWDDIAADNPYAAVRMDEIFGRAAAKLAKHPRPGKPGKISGTREMVLHEHYRLVYETSGDTVWILALVHTSRKWPTVRE